jgi:hypothetical protein
MLTDGLPDYMRAFGIRTIGPYLVQDGVLSALVRP